MYTTEKFGLCCFLKKIEMLTKTRSSLKYNWSTDQTLQFIGSMSPKCLEDSITKTKLSGIAYSLKFGNCWAIAQKTTWSRGLMNDSRDTQTC